MRIDNSFTSASDWTILCVLLGAVVSLSCLAPAASAQSATTVIGRIISEDQPTLGLADAELSVANIRTRSDSAGAFRLQGVPIGRQTILIRRVGYFEQQESIDISVLDDTPIIISLKAVAPVLDTVKVKATRIPMGMEPFEERRLHGQGTYLTRAELEKERNRQLSEVLVRVSGLNVIRLMGGDAAVAGRRGSPSIIGRERGGDSMDKRRGAPNACYSQVFVDGVRVFAPEPGRPLFNINTFSPGEIEGIEFYRSSIETPAQYSTLESDCGTMLIWTRKGDPAK